MEFLEAAGSRRSTRWFKTWEPVPKEKVQEVLEVIRTGVGPANLQPWFAVVVYRDELDDATREELLKADNWQGQHAQAPVWVYFYGDPEKARSEDFARSILKLCEWGAVPLAYGWSKDRVEAAIQHAEETPRGMAGIHEYMHDVPVEASAMLAFAEGVAACSLGTLAATNAGLGVCLNMIAKPTAQDRVKEILGVPARCVPVWIMLLGYPAEGRECGGQRPKSDFESVFFSGQYGTPFPRAEAVVDQAHCCTPSAAGSAAPESQ